MYCSILCCAICSGAIYYSLKYAIEKFLFSIVSLSLAMITKRLKSTLIALLSLSLVIFITKLPFNSNLSFSTTEKLIHGQFLLEDILNDEQKIMKTNGNQIFFIETHLDEFRDLKNARQACSVESAGEIFLA